MQLQAWPCSILILGVLVNLWAQLTQHRFICLIWVVAHLGEVACTCASTTSLPTLSIATMSRLKPQFGGLRTPLRQNYVPHGLGYCRVPKRAAPRMPAAATRVHESTQMAASAQGSTSGGHPTSGTDSGIGSETSSSPSKPSKPPLGGFSLTALPADLSAIAMVYFVQGIMELAVLAQTYHLKDNLHADPAQVSWFLSLAGIPWALKPLIGFVSDTVPLWGYHRRSYLLLASAAGCASYLLMSASGGNGAASGLWGFVGAMLLASGASAVSDVVADSMVVTRAREESQESAGSLQSLCWASYAIGQVLTASMSGALVQDYGPATVFQLTAMFPLLVGMSSFLVQEEQSSTDSSSPIQSVGNSNGVAVEPTAAAMLNTTADNIAGPEAVPAYAYLTVPVAGGPSTTASLAAMARPYGGSPTVFACNVESAAASASGDSYPTGFVATNHALFVNHSANMHSHTAAEPMVLSHASADHTLNASVTAHTAVLATGAATPTAAAAATAGVDQSATRNGFTATAVSERTAQLWAALRQPDVLAPLCFLLLLSATPTADTAIFYYQTEHLNFTPSFLGQVQLAAACASFGGVLLYNAVLKKLRMRDLMLWGTLLGAALQCGQLLLVSGMHRQWGVDDHTLVLGGSVVMDIIQNVLSMPTMVLAARLCPPGLEATMFATIMSACNIADGVRLAGGAALMSALGVTADDFTNLPLLLLVCNACLLLPLPLLQQIPEKYARGESDTESDADDVAQKQQSSSSSSLAHGSTKEAAAQADTRTSRTANVQEPSFATATAQHFQDLWSHFQTIVNKPAIRLQDLAQSLISGISAPGNNSTKASARTRYLPGGLPALPTHATSIRVQSSPLRRRAHCTRGHAAIKHFKRMHAAGWDGWDAPSLDSLVAFSETPGSLAGMDGLPESNSRLEQRDVHWMLKQHPLLQTPAAMRRACHMQQRRKLRRQLVRQQQHAGTPADVLPPSSVPIHAAVVGYDQPPDVVPHEEHVMHSKA